VRKIGLGVRDPFGEERVDDRLLHAVALDVRGGLQPAQGALRRRLAQVEALENALLVRRSVAGHHRAARLLLGEVEAPPVGVELRLELGQHRLMRRLASRRPGR